MKRLRIGIVDYACGNHASVQSALKSLGYSCTISRYPDALGKLDCLVVPGVGAFPHAMAALHKFNLKDFLCGWALEGKPLVGICLGMQLLASQSHEDGVTEGLGIIPGEVVPLREPRWHIGWNSIERLHRDPLINLDQTSHFYFNHAYMFSGGAEFCLYQSYCGRKLPAIVRRGSVVGLQFHPEKSQHAGQKLLKQIIGGLCDA